MSESNFMHGWVVLLGLLATIALVLMAFGLMLGVVKPADALKHVGAILGIVIVLSPGMILSAWSGMSLWQQIALVAIGVGVWQWQRLRRQTRKRRGAKSPG